MYATEDRFSELNEAAQRSQEAANSMALEAVRARTAPEKHPDFDGENCLVCSLPVPKQRLAMGRIRCVNCQAAVERKSQLYRR